MGEPDMHPHPSIAGDRVMGGQAFTGKAVGRDQDGAAIMIWPSIEAWKADQLAFMKMIVPAPHHIVDGGSYFCVFHQPAPARQDGGK